MKKEEKMNYWLPNERGEKIDKETENNSVIIIGANGSGKSKLGAWIEQQDLEKVHRIGAQRKLNFNENIQLKSYKEAENLVFYGDSTSLDKGYRWEWGKLTTKLIDDFEYVLAALIALKNNQNEEFIDKYKNTEKENREQLQSPITVVDNLKNVWDEVFPHREIILRDSKFYTKLKDEEYSSTEMSDGERSVLYLASQVLTVPKDKILIIDEPELHLHPSIMNSLWKSLEKMREDCLFIYITHDTEFAALHSNSDKIWVKEYDGKNWKLEEIKDNELPEELLLEILGSRKNILFVEGEKNSYDTQLYVKLYPNYYIVPCGSCEQVIWRTKVFRKSPLLHHCEVYGIIDRDFRSEYEINEYKKDKIFTLEVAEVENLFLVEELIQAFCKFIGEDSVGTKEKLNKIKKYIIKERFEKQLDGQVSKKSIAEIKYRLSTIDINEIKQKDLETEIKKRIESFNFDEEKNKFKEASESNNYREVLKLFNEKKLVESIGHFLEINNKHYCSRILKLLNNNKDANQEFVEALKNYLPSEIPR